MSFVPRPRETSMMMAHDSTPGGRPLDVETISALRSALLAYVDAPADGERLRIALHSVAREARDKAILPETLLIALKEIWHDLPSIRAAQQPESQIRLLQRVVTMCIKEYYSP